MDIQKWLNKTYKHMLHFLNDILNLLNGIFHASNGMFRERSRLGYMTKLNSPR